MVKHGLTTSTDTLESFAAKWRSQTWRGPQIDAIQNSTLCSLSALSNLGKPNIWGGWEDSPIFHCPTPQRHLSMSRLDYSLHQLLLQRLLGPNDPRKTGCHCRETESLRRWVLPTCLLWYLSEKTCSPGSNGNPFGRLGHWDGTWQGEPQKHNFWNHAMIPWSFLLGLAQWPQNWMIQNISKHFKTKTWHCRMWVSIDRGAIL